MALHQRGLSFLVVSSKLPYKKKKTITCNVVYVPKAYKTVFLVELFNFPVIKVCLKVVSLPDVFKENYRMRTNKNCYMKQCVCLMLTMANIFGRVTFTLFMVLTSWWA